MKIFGGEFTIDWLAVAYLALPLSIFGLFSVLKEPFPGSRLVGSVSYAALFFAVTFLISLRVKSPKVAPALKATTMLFLGAVTPVFVFGLRLPHLYESVLLLSLALVVLVTVRRIFSGPIHYKGMK